jgi:hypothetical protein
LQAKLLDGKEMMGKATRTMERRDEKGNNNRNKTCNKTITEI